MKKIKNLSEGNFLKLLFAFLSAAFLIAAVCMPDRDTMLSGFVKILITPCKVTTNYFSVGGFAATFFNMGLMGLISLIFVLLIGGVINGPVIAGIFTIVGFIITVGLISEM